jgi:uncharacterized Fe-S center protein
MGRIIKNTLTVILLTILFTAGAMAQNNNSSIQSSSPITATIMMSNSNFYVNQEVNIPLIVNPNGNNFNKIKIDYGDGKTEEQNTGSLIANAVYMVNFTHTYTTKGTYEIKINVDNQTPATYEINISSR